MVDPKAGQRSSALPRTVGVYGLGRFGRFWAELLSESFDVVAWSRSSRDLPPGVEFADERTVCAADALFLCVAISSFSDVVGRVAPLLGPETVVADTCSIKVHPVEVMRNTLPATTPILATHPMFGPDSAGDGVAGLPIVLHRERLAEDRWQAWRGFFADIGLSVIEMTPDDHDQEAAFTQGITHYLGRVMAEVGARRSPIATMGYRKLVEIIEQTCNDSWQLFVDLQRFNRHTVEMRKQLDHALETVRGKLADSIDSAEDG